jgi:hypothetical protein
MYHINKGLSVVSAETTDRLYLVPAREDCRNQRNDLVWKEGATYQASAGRRTEFDGDG